MGGRANGWLVAWLLLAAAGQVAAVEAVRRVFLSTIRGQLVDTAALDGNTIGRRHIDWLVDTVLGAVTVLSVVVAVLAIGFIALLRGRVLLAGAAALLVVGSNLTTQLLKQLVVRPDLGVDLERAVAGNSLPSGHATVAGSVAVALVLVLPPSVRGLAAVLGAGYAAVAGGATLSADWHRPSDSVTALLIVGVWAALAGLLLAVRRPAPGAAGPPHRRALAILLLVGLGALVVATVAMGLTDRALAGEVQAGADLATRQGLLSRGELLTAYAGGAAWITGVASLMMAVVLLTVHRVVPARDHRSGPPGQLAAHPAAARPA
jgi:membrane-associated phospholipid phosphatase